MPKIKTNQSIKNLKDEVIKLGEGEKESLTLGMVLAEVILLPHNRKDGYRPLDALKLAQKFYKEEEVEVSASEFLQLKAIIEEANIVPLIKGRVLEHLEEIK